MEVKTLRKIVCSSQGRELEISYQGDFFLSSVDGLSNLTSTLDVRQTAQIDGGIYTGAVSYTHLDVYKRQLKQMGSIRQAIK